MKVEVKKILLENYKKFPSKSVDLFPRTEISGRNREGKSTLQDAYLDVLTGKMANGTEPTSIRRKENGVEVPKVDVVRELTLSIDGKEKSNPQNHKTEVEKTERTVRRGVRWK